MVLNFFRQLPGAPFRKRDVTHTQRTLGIRTVFEFAPTFQNIFQSVRVIETAPGSSCRENFGRRGGGGEGDSMVAYFFSRSVFRIRIAGLMAARFVHRYVGLK